MVSEWNLWVWLECIGVVIIIIIFPYSTCVSSFFGNSIPISLFIFKMFFFIFLNVIFVKYNSKRCSKNIRDGSNIEIRE